MCHTMARDTHGVLFCPVMSAYAMSAYSIRMFQRSTHLQWPKECVAPSLVANPAQTGILYVMTLLKEYNPACATCQFPTDDMQRCCFACSKRTNFLPVFRVISQT